MATGESALAAQQVNELLSKYKIEFAADRGADAREAQANFGQLWSSLISAAAQKTLIGVHDSAYEFIQLSVDAYIKANKPEISDGPQGVFYIEANFPLLLRTEMGRFNEPLLHDPWVVIAAIFVRFGQTIGAALSTVTDAARFALTKLMIDPRMSTATARFAAATQSSALLEDYERKEKRLTAQVVASLKRIDAQVLVASNLQEELASDRAARAVEEDARKRAFDEFLDEGRGRIDAIQKQATEATILKGATDLWSNKASSHAWRFGLGLAAIVIVVCLILFEIYSNAGDFLASLPKKPDGEVTYVTVALLTICAIAAGWILRFFGRFVTENMVMQTDAAQRRTMLETYLALVGDKDAKMEQADRTLILNAIFRPLPGHQNEDIAPPTLTEVVRSAASGGKPA